MAIEDFVKQIEEEFEDLPPGTIKPDTVFRNLDGWSSMMALIVIAKIDAAFNVTITAEELSQCKSVNDLFALTKRRAVDG